MSEWINKSALSSLSELQAKYVQMSNVRVVTGAACVAGENTFKPAMTNIIMGEPSLASYHDVAQGLQVWDSPDDVHVGIPEDSPLFARAQQMDEIYPVAKTTHDLELQSGDTDRAFEKALAEAVSLS
jgi:hypothetical protein